MQDWKDKQLSNVHIDSQKDSEREAYVDYNLQYDLYEVRIIVINNALIITYLTYLVGWREHTFLEC